MPAAQAQGNGAMAAAAGEKTVSASLSATSQTYALPLSGGYSATLSLHANGVPAGTKLLLGVRQPQMSAPNEAGARADSRKTRSCPATLTIPLFNPFSFPIVLNVDGFSIKLPCTVDGTLFGVSFYQLQPVPATVSSLKVGDVTAVGKSITFTSDVSTITLPPQTETALSIIPEGSTSEVGIPIVPGANTLITSNASSSISSSLSILYASSGGGGTLFSSGCFPAYAGGVLNSALASAVFLGTPSYFCTLGTVNSATVLFGSPTVTFTIGAPLADVSFIGYDGPAGEFLCAPTGTTTCTTPAFTVPTVQNVIVGNVRDLQVCIPAAANADCNTNVHPAASPAPQASSIPSGSQIELLVADDPTYASSNTRCSASANCGGLSLSTSGSCSIDDGADDNSDIPPGYNDPGGPQQSPPVSSGTSTSANFPAVGPFAGFDLD
ncbi:MAG TPA: hypothetical protein VKG44_03990, partial [Candidatus Baltobacteraceae bacterium]|nr:hypothetical protein [Candidatus Baltobacteraceae bacterium]